jgi:hypothetical protein
MMRLTLCDRPGCKKCNGEWSKQLRELLMIGIRRGWSLTGEDQEKMRALLVDGVDVDACEGTVH